MCRRGCALRAAIDLPGESESFDMVESRDTDLLIAVDGAKIGADGVSVIVLNFSTAKISKNLKDL